MKQYVHPICDMLQAEPEDLLTMSVGSNGLDMDNANENDYGIITWPGIYK